MNMRVGVNNERIILVFPYCIHEQPTILLCSGTTHLNCNPMSKICDVLICQICNYYNSKSSYRHQQHTCTYMFSQSKYV